MSTLTRRENRGLFPDLLDWLEPPYTLLRPFSGQVMRFDQAIDNGRFVVRAELPGIDPEKQAKVTMLNGILTIQADRPESPEGCSRSEFRYGTFTRHLALPENADEADIEASYDRGILKVAIGLKTTAKSKTTERSIPIRQIQHPKPT